MVSGWWGAQSRAMHTSMHARTRALRHTRTQAHPAQPHRPLSSPHTRWPWHEMHSHPQCKKGLRVLEAHQTLSPLHTRQQHGLASLIHCPRAEPAWPPPQTKPTLPRPPGRTHNPRYKQAQEVLEVGQLPAALTPHVHVQRAAGVGRGRQRRQHRQHLLHLQGRGVCMQWSRVCARAARRWGWGQRCA